MGNFQNNYDCIGKIWFKEKPLKQKAKERNEKESKTGKKKAHKNNKMRTRKILTSRSSKMSLMVVVKFNDSKQTSVFHTHFSIFHGDRNDAQSTIVSTHSDLDQFKSQSGKKIRIEKKITIDFLTTRNHKVYF